MTQGVSFLTAVCTSPVKSGLTCRQVMTDTSVWRRTGSVEQTERAPNNGRTGEALEVVFACIFSLSCGRALVEFAGGEKGRISGRRLAPGKISGAQKPFRGVTD
ncbi:hypothetical protein Bbelb_368980 [Branchiostoma belcheri]|nr:hypothetical protein Bbelb_368980 [Branchiostoma belcheri]